MSDIPMHIKQEEQGGVPAEEPPASVRAAAPFDAMDCSLKRALCETECRAR